MRRVPHQSSGTGKHPCTHKQISIPTYADTHTVIRRYMSTSKSGPKIMCSVAVNLGTSFCMVTVESRTPGELAVKTLNFCIF